MVTPARFGDRRAVRPRRAAGARAAFATVAIVGTAALGVIVGTVGAVGAATQAAKTPTRAAAASATPAAPGRVLAARLRAAGRAEARFERVAPDPLSGETSRMSGRLAMELPDRFALDVTGSGERIVATGAGGAWLRPDLRQLIRMGPEQAGAVRRAWQLLLGESSEAVRVTTLGARRYAIAVTDPALEPLRLEVTLDAARLPSRIDYVENGQTQTYHVRGWRFVPRRGPAAFTLAAPAGFDTLRLP